MINISSSTTDLIFDVQDFTGRNVRNISHISVLIELAYTSGNHKLFNDLIFKAKYLKGLKNISQKEISGNNIDIKTAIEKILSEISTELNNLTKIIQEVIFDLSPEEKGDFENNFFLMKNECLLKYYELIEDLSMFKEFFNAKT
jgi:hypothetical protein